MKVTRAWAEKTARDFLSKANPTNWDGVGEKPKEFNCHNYFTYDFGSPYVVLDISFDFYAEEDGERMWCHCCEIVDKESFGCTDKVECCEVLSGYGVDSYLNLADTILDICNNTADWFDEVG